MITGFWKKGNGNGTKTFEFNPWKKNLNDQDNEIYNSPKLSEEAKHPIESLSKCALTRLIVHSTHVKNWHVGIQHTLLAKKEFLIVQRNASVKHYFKDSSRCVIHKAKSVS